MAVIRVCLVEDQALVREGIMSLLMLSEDIEIATMASDGIEAVDKVLMSQPDVLLLDLELPGQNGIEVLKKLKTAGFLPPTLILTTFGEDSLVMDAIRAGAKGYLLKDVTFGQLVRGIRILSEGGTLFLPTITERIMHNFGGESKPSHSIGQKNPFTEREIEVLRLLAGGYSNREIAEALNVVEGTIKNHVSNILTKLEVRDRTRAVLKALEWGYL